MLEVRVRIDNIVIALLLKGHWTQLAYRLNILLKKYINLKTKKSVNVYRTQDRFGLHPS